MSERKKRKEIHETEALTIEIEGERITIIKDKERWISYIDEETLPRSTIDTWKQDISGALYEGGQEASPDTIDVYSTRPIIKTIRICPNCGAHIYKISARYCDICGEKL